jgi:hypothetical protein
MGTDRDEWGEGSCPCGKGKIVITHCSPDHPWGGRAWLEGAIECDDCRQGYALVRSEGVDDIRFRLVTQADCEERSSHWRAQQSKIAAIKKMPEVERIFAQAISALDQAQSVAAKYRLLSSVGLASGSEQKFRRRWQGSAEYVSHQSVDALPNLMRMINVPADPLITEALADADAEKAKSRVPVSTIKTGIRGLVE